MQRIILVKILKVFGFRASLELGLDKMLRKKKRICLKFPQNFLDQISVFFGWKEADCWEIEPGVWLGLEGA